MRRSPLLLGYSSDRFPCTDASSGSPMRIYMTVGRSRSPIQVYILDSSHMCVTTRLPSSLSELKLQLARHLQQIEMRDEHDRSLIGGRPCRRAQAIEWDGVTLAGPSPLNDFDFYVMPREEALAALRWSRIRLGRSSVFFLNRSTKMRWSKGLHFGQFIAQDHLGRLVAPRRVLEATDLTTIDFAENVLIARPRERQLLHLPKLTHKRSTKRVAFKKDLEEWLVCDPNDDCLPVIFRPLQGSMLAEMSCPQKEAARSLPPWALPFGQDESMQEDLTFYEIQFGGVSTAVDPTIASM